MISEAVLAADGQTPYSHTGVIRVINGVPFVVHAITGEPQGGDDIVKAEPLALFLAYDRASATAVYRLKEDADHVADKAADVALSYAARRVPFDGDFDLASADKLYCTELVWRAYREVGVDLVDGHFDNLSIPMSKGAYILPSSLMKSARLKKVISLETGD
jgi:uncharacterized protein YycO